MELLATIGLILIAIGIIVLIAMIISTTMAVYQMLGDIEDLKIDVENLKKKKGKKHEKSN